MDNQEFLTAKNDFDLENVRSKLIKCIFELQSKRSEVTSMKSSLDESNRTKATLEQDTKNFQREIADLRDQLKIALDALNQKDSVRTGFLENAARLNVQLEAMTNDQERLKSKLQSSQSKIMELTRDNNKLQEKIRVLEAAGNQPVESVDRIWKAMDTLNGHLQKLEAEHLTLAKTAEESNKIAGEAAEAVLRGRNELSELQTKNNELEARVLELSSQIVSMQSVQNNGSLDVSDAENEVEEHLKVLKEELEQEREDNQKLKNDISALLTLQDCLSKQLEQAMARYGVGNESNEGENQKSTKNESQKTPEDEDEKPTADEGKEPIESL
ncbi:myosin-2 heavy chain-like [Malaya genurostris]|uniref:myosin-2 heavy chain-like n=1 Tax=Malaya genurostris TaxID=325434 RepID=UPI0026F3D795|nr:myosin-2 heavy chain-like [Malaya genurostris]